MARTDAEAFASAAEGMIGARFRLHGRDPEGGLDCVGLVHASLAAIGRHPVAPQGYALRNWSITHWLEHAAVSGFVPVAAPIMRGDLLLVMPSPVQHHLLIAAGTHSVIHAHAGLRRVVRQPRDGAAQMARHWRLAPQH